MAAQLLLSAGPPAEDLFAAPTPAEWAAAPTEAELWGDDDPDSGPQPAWADETATVTPADLLAERLGTASLAARLPACDRVGILAPPDPHGAGFSLGGAADELAPGVVLAGLAERTWREGLPQVSDDALVGVMRAFRRLSSWATAGEAAAIAELDRRRTAQVAAGADPQLAEHLPEEIAPPLTLTSRGAGLLYDFACRLAALPATKAALAAGQIDRSKAGVIISELTGLSDPAAAAVEAAVIGRAPGQTSGELRAAVRRAVLAVDPAAARIRRQEAQKDARVEVWEEPAGTAALAGRDLPAADVLAADRHLSALARHLKTAGADGTLSQLRARAYLALLLGTPVVLREPASPPDSQQATPQPAAAQGAMSGPLTGSVNLTMPMSAWLDGVTGTGEVPGYGPISAEDAQQLARGLASAPRTRWCITLTAPDGRALAHGCARYRATASGPGQDPQWELTVKIKPLATGTCQHWRESPGYQPSAALRHVVSIRQPTCTAPGCRRPASQCDHDHTVPYHLGGRTCECNLGPLCRRHHRAKQAQGWRLTQPAPGSFAWQLPHGRTYISRASPYPRD